MQQDLAERRIKALQKEVLVVIESHPFLNALEPEQFNMIRRRVFRGTFDAYRLGVLGMEVGHPDLVHAFFHWLDDSSLSLGPALQRDVSLLCFRTALVAFRIGSMVAATREAHSP